MGEKESLQIIRSPLLERFSRLTHAFTTRPGGISCPPYDSLNLSAKSGDDELAVEKNQQILSEALSIEADLFFLNQVHGDSVIVAEDAGSAQDKRDADAVITGKPETPLVILTADCLSILLFAADDKSIGAVHAGWRGTALNIAGQTVNRMVSRFNINPAYIYAAMGPTIGPCCYEVDSVVYEQFRQSSKLWDKGSLETDRNAERRWMLDLATINRLQLEEAGIDPEHISRTPYCTSCHKNLFYSYRRDGRSSGRQGSIIMLT
jgi:YfiH family protein